MWVMFRALLLFYAEIHMTIECETEEGLPTFAVVNIITIRLDCWVEFFLHIFIAIFIAVPRKVEKVVILYNTKKPVNVKYAEQATAEMCRA